MSDVPGSHVELKKLWEEYEYYSDEEDVQWAEENYNDGYDIEAMTSLDIITNIMSSNVIVNPAVVKAGTHRKAVVAMGLLMDVYQEIGNMVFDQQEED